MAVGVGGDGVNVAVAEGGTNVGGGGGVPHNEGWQALMMIETRIASVMMLGFFIAQNYTIRL